MRLIAFLNAQPTEEWLLQWQAQTRDIVFLDSSRGYPWNSCLESTYGSDCAVLIVDTGCFPEGDVAKTVNKYVVPGRGLILRRYQRSVDETGQCMLGVDSRHLQIERYVGRGGDLKAVCGVPFEIGVACAHAQDLALVGWFDGAYAPSGWYAMHDLAARLCKSGVTFSSRFNCGVIDTEVGHLGSWDGEESNRRLLCSRIGASAADVEAYYQGRLLLDDWQRRSADGAHSF